MFWLARLGQSEQPTQRPGKPLLGLRQLANGVGIGRIGRSSLQTADRCVACTNDRFERFTLVLDVSLGRFDQIRNQVMTTGQLHVDLRKRILVPVAPGNQAVVNRDAQQNDSNDDDQDDPTHAHGSSPR